MSIKTTLKRVIPAPLLRVLLPVFRASRTAYVRTRTRVRALRFESYPRPRRIELGPGDVAPPSGWLSVDMTPTATFYCDLRKPLPFPSRSVDEFYSSHVLEHLSLPQLLYLIRECRRVLRPGGVFNVAVPNGGMFVRSYCDPELRHRLRESVKTSLDCQLGTSMDVVNHIAHLGGEHHFLFDEDNLVALLDEAGLTDARIRDFDPNRDVPQRREESIYAIAFAPADPDD
jgi:predicted SAM-dependent methyltransferase